MKTKPSGWKTPVCKIHNIPEKTRKVVQRAGAMDKTIDEFHFKNSPPPFTKSGWWNYKFKKKTKKLRNEDNSKIFRYS